jgi:hypothetical protein
MVRRTVYEHHDRQLIMFTGSIGPVDVQAQTVFRIIPEDGQVERQEALAHKSRLRACRALVNSRDQGPRTRSVRLWWLESIFTRRVVGVANTMECLNTILVKALIGHAIVELGDRLVIAIVAVDARNRPGQAWQGQCQVVLKQHSCRCVAVCMLLRTWSLHFSTRAKSQRDALSPASVSVSIIIVCRTIVNTFVIFAIEITVFVGVANSRTAVASWSDDMDGISEDLITISYSGSSERARCFVYRTPGNELTPLAVRQ